LTQRIYDALRERGEATSADIATKAKVTPWHPSLEFRGNRGIVIIAPSLHKSGCRYTWAPGQSLDDLRMPKVPKRVLAALEKAVASPAAPRLLKKLARVVTTGIDASLLYIGRNWSW